MPTAFNLKNPPTGGIFCFVSRRTAGAFIDWIATRATLARNDKCDEADKT